MSSQGCHAKLIVLVKVEFRLGDVSLLKLFQGI